MKGKKTYAAGIGLILASISPAFSAEGFNPALIDLQGVFTGFGLIFLRSGVNTTAKAKP